MALLLAACEPLVDLGDSDSSSTGSPSGGVSGGPGSVPPNPTTPVTTNPGTGGGCVPGTIGTCDCPSGFPGAQECGFDGTYLPCECDDPQATTGWDTWGSSSTGWWGSSSTGWGSSSTGGDPGVYIPELPPGETCLPPELPCEGDFDIGSDAQLEPMRICSVIQGDVYISGNVETVSSLPCLQEVSTIFVIIESPLSTIDVPVLEAAGLFAIGVSPNLQSISAPALAAAADVFIGDNESLSSIDLPSLTFSKSIEVFNNPMLPDCVAVELAEQVGNPVLSCQDNLEDMCSPMCG